MSEHQSQSFQSAQSELLESKDKTKVFQFEKGSIVYSNFQQTIVNQQNDTRLAVNNYLCYQEGDRLIKIIEIYVDDKILRIRDELKIVSQLNQGEREQKKTKGVFGRRNNYTDPSRNQKSDTKNLIKNIINLFGNWLRGQDTEIAEKANRKLKQIIKKKVYFNKLLIQQLCQDRGICECFVQFSINDSQAAIENSRIKDKACHLKAMKNYTKIFEDTKNKAEKQSTKTTESKSQN